MEIDIILNKNNLTDIATAQEAGVWRLLVYSDQLNILPFMTKDENISFTTLRVGDLIIDDVRYSKYENFSDLAPKRFIQDKEVVYFITDDYAPAWEYESKINYTVGIGLTTGNSHLLNDILYQGGLNYFPKITEEADELNARKMKFYTANLELINIKGEYDNSFDFFGNSVQVYGRTDTTRIPLYEYYVKNTKTKIDKATFVLGDKRQRLSQKIPNTRFTVDEYPYMVNPGNAEQKSGKLGEFIPDAYGHLTNIPAICIDEFQIYSSGTTLKTFRTFKVARKITSLEKVLVKMTQPDDDTGSKEVWTDQYALGHITNIDYENGTFQMGVQYCMPTFTGYDVPEIYDVHCTGVFCPQQKPSEVIQEILNYYAQIPYDSKNYNVTQWQAELSNLINIGIYFDSETDIFSAIEEIQNASNFNFMFKTDFDRFTAIKDDNDRAVAREIKAMEILNIDDVEIDMNAEQYATSVDISYNENYLDDTQEHLIDDRNEKAIMNIYHVPKVYSVESKLSSKADAQNKADKLIKYFSKLRTRINGIKLFGVQWFDIKIYDIINIDLRLEIEKEIIPKRFFALVNYLEKTYTGVNEKTEEQEVLTSEFNSQNYKEFRKFGGMLKCKVLKVARDTKTETVELDLVFVG
ncbi:MAG: hypothetical protein LBQ37_02425 [Elusimicrobiota bacterium]|jgi:hypothetical protein|nr:hypothetical protein [Elusimicrobiota bacterium]